MNNRIAIFATLAMLVIFAMPVAGQWDARLSHFWAGRAYYNPAFAGETDMIRAAAFYQRQWQDVANPPERYVAVADAPLNFEGWRQGVGVVASSHKLGGAVNSQLSAMYAARWRVGNGRLSVGVQAGFSKIGFDAGAVVVDGGQLTATPANKQTADINVGIAWTSERYYVGASVAHITRPSVVVADSSFHIPRTYYFMAGCNIAFLDALYQLQPSVLVYTADGDVEVETALCLVYADRFWGGGSWRFDNGMSLFGGITVGSIDVGYAYASSRLRGMAKNQASHEICLRYCLPFDLGRNSRPASKSVRIL